jgi:acyl-CoA hydrolase
MTLQPRPARLSRTEHTQIVLKEHINGQNRLFGGRLMEWIDVVAAVAARRHAGCNVTTASIDTLNFKAPAFINDTIVLVGKVTYAGRTSMEVRVDTYVEALDGERTCINTAYLVLVALLLQRIHGLGVFLDDLLDFLFFDAHCFEHLPCKCHLSSFDLWMRPITSASVMETKKEPLN